MLAGNRDDAVMSVVETYREHISDTQREAAKEADVEWDDLDWDDQAAIVQAVDTNSDPGEQLDKQVLSNTRQQLGRRRLNDHSTGDFQQRAYEAGATWGQDDVRDVRVRAIFEHLAGYGIDLDDAHDHEALEEDVDHGPYNYTDSVKLELISYNDVDDLIPSETDKTLSFTDPHVLSIDTMNGSGHDVQLKGTLTVPVPAEPGEEAFYTDAGGYSWDEVCGLHQPGYRTQVAVKADEEKSAPVPV